MSKGAKKVVALALFAGLAAGAGAGWLVGVKRGVPFVDTIDHWSIGIYKGKSPLALTTEGVDNPVLTAADVTDVPATYVADPFMVKEGDTWYMFLEILNSATGQGDLGVATSPDGVKWTYKQVVLDESFHLSYPQVFKWEGKYYMLPESYQDRSVRLYRATKFPTKWELVTKVIDGSKLIDTSILRHGDRWWLFTSTYSNDTLLLYHSEKLEGPYLRHPKNPIIAGDANIARPGGRVIVWDGRPVRFPQDDEPEYGTAVYAYEILELTPTTYRERRLGKDAILKPSGAGWNADGMHHIDAHRRGKGDWIAVVDGYHWKRVFGLRY